MYRVRSRNHRISGTVLVTAVTGKRASPGSSLVGWIEVCTLIARAMAVEACTRTENTVGLAGEVRRTAAVVASDTNVDRAFSGAGGMLKVKRRGIVDMACGTGCKGRELAHQKRGIAAVGRMRLCQRCRGSMTLTALVGAAENRGSPGRRDRLKVAIDVCTGAGHRQGCLWPGRGAIIIDCCQRRIVDVGGDLDQAGAVGRGEPITAGMAFYARCRRGACSGMGAMFANKTAGGWISHEIVNRTDIRGI